MNWVHKLLRKFTRYAHEHPLSHRVTMYVIACSFLFIVLSTALQLVLSYKRELQAIDQQIELINSSYLASLTKSLWDVDQAQIELQLKGIQALSNVTHLTLNNIDNEPVIIVDLPEPDPSHKVRQHKFDLIYTGPDQLQRSLGQLRVDFDLQALYNRIWREGLRILLNQTLLVLLIALVITVIFRRQITRHLETMANYSLEIGAGQLDSRLKLDRQAPKRSDELDQLVSALNEMQQAIQKDILRRDQQHQQLQFNRDQLKIMVERRTKSLLRAKEAAEDADKAKSQFLSTMSHEIRTPMNGMLGMIQLLEDSSLTRSQQQQVQVLHDSTNALLETFNNILEYGRLSESAYTNNATQFSLPQLLEAVISINQATANEKKLSISLHIDSKITEYYQGHENNLRQILTNLLSNAIKFTESGTVHLQVSALIDDQEKDQKKQTLRFEVIDSGIGIPTQLQEHIFERFTQADETITRRYGGTGLGLSICKELAQEANGRIGLSSTEGEGSTFWVELPFSISGQLSDQKTDSIPITKALHILLVEDVEINQLVVSGLIEKHHQVSIANDGLKALNLCQQEKFDLILMDIHLPGLSGIEVSQKVKNDSLCINQSTRIIALTASVQTDDIHTYIKVGFDGVLAKPIHKEQLTDVINSSMQAGLNQTPHAQTSPPLLDQSIIAAHRQVIGEKKLAELMSRFCTLHDDLWPSLQQSVQQQDDYDCEQLAHKFAGTCDILGFALSSSLLRDIEMFAQNNQLNKCVDSINTLTPVMQDTLDIASQWQQK